MPKPMTFEEWLLNKHHSINDGTYKNPDSFEAWLEELYVDDWLKYGQEFKESNEAVKLKPCPFCGKEAILQSDGALIIGGEKAMRVGCETLACRGNIAFTNYSTKFNSFSLWNTRAKESK